MIDTISFDLFGFHFHSPLSKTLTSLQDKQLGLLCLLYKYVFLQ